MDKIFSLKSPRRGFSLIEMLAVVVIIGILAGIIAAAAQAARRRAKITKMRTEINGLKTALETYKTEIGGGDYPPSDPTQMERHFRRAFPRYIPPATGIPVSFNGPDEAIHFWLAGPTGEGWSADPMNPFADVVSVPTRYGPYYEFDDECLTGHVYKPFETSIDPYLYIKAASYTTTSCTVPSGTAVTAIEQLDKSVTPATPKLVNPISFQIHCPGLDGEYGSGGYLNDTTNYTDDRWDDMGDFCPFTLEDKNK